MSDFAVRVCRLRTVELHPNADRLDLAVVGEYRSVVGRGQFSARDLVAYLPEAAVLPDELVAELGLVGKLAGPAKNRVKAVRLRGVVSQGICMAARPGWAEGQDVAAELGVAKWQPPVPTGMQGVVCSVGLRHLVQYDVENWKKFPEVIADGEEVVVTEKIHGTFCMVSVTPDGVLVASKGLGGKGLAFDLDSGANKGNLYVRTARRLPLAEIACTAPGLEAVVVCGEVFGRGVQDLHYGFDAGKDATLGFRVFDVCEVAVGGKKTWLDHDALRRFCDRVSLAMVPVLYRGPFSREVLTTHTNGPSTLGGDHMREGCVVQPVVDRYLESSDLPCGGRVKLKSVSDDYLFRRGEQTEFE